MTTTNLEAARETYKKIAANISKIMRGQDAATRQLLAALAAGGLERETLTRAAKICWTPCRNWSGVRSARLEAG